jgi:polyphosphate kinase
MTTLQASATAAKPLSAKQLLKHAWIDRDLGWLQFNERVLNESFDSRNPLLERLKFLAIFSSNLDEFYMKRVSVLRNSEVREDDEDPFTSGDNARAGLARIRTDVSAMLNRQATCYLDTLLPALASHGIRLETWDGLTAAQREEASLHFDQNISPALTPLGLDATHPFPFMSNQSTNWGIVLREPAANELSTVRIKIPTGLSGWVPLTAEVGRGERLFIQLDDLIRANAHKLFPGLEIVDATPFRILRNAQVELDDDDRDSLRDAVTEAIRQRRFEPVVRIDFRSGANNELRRALAEHFHLGDEDIFEVRGLLDYTTLFQIAGLDAPELRDVPWTPLAPARIPHEDTDVFAVVRAGDVLVHHPFESFDLSVEQFIHDAANDPQTVAIKMTVYRVGDDTPFVRSLIRAAEGGKQVACVIELQARFDEARNIHWAKEMEKVGAHVAYGVLGLKIHTKVALVVRKEGQKLRCYAHVGTGNYHVKTARLYTDVGLLTCDPAITADVVNLFHHLTGRSTQPHFGKLLVAPFNMRDRFHAMIEREIEHHRAGRAARIVAKMNQVEDLELSLALAKASQVGVPIDLIVRGFCCLRPGVPGYTENVRVRSIIGRFLEHSRIFYFANGKSDPLDGEFYIGSADWMYRNLSRRVEAATPVEDRTARRQLWEILDTSLQDSRQSWDLGADGAYVQCQPPLDGAGPARVGTHAWLMQLARQRVAGKS